MCGIAGSFVARPDALDPVVVEMTRRLHHRGPDDAGVERLGGACFGATRLSLLDFEHGAQPMVDDRGLLSYNGELFNERALRDDLERRGVRFRGRCDTEVLWHLLAQNRPTASDAELRSVLQRLDGMWAFAWSDGTELVLARDPFGIKPLLYASTDDGRRLVFASELKALLAEPGLDRAIDRAALLERSIFGWSLGDKTLLRGVRSLPPGHWLRAVPRPDGRLALEVRRHAPTAEEIRAAAGGAGADDAPRTVEAAVDRLCALLDASVAAQRLADHPVGAYLSGGVDSTLLVALLDRHAPGGVHTFAAGDRSDHPDVAMAREVAAALGTRHHEQIVDARSLAEALPASVAALERPDPPSIAETLAPSIRTRVKAVLCGDGADELFAGYAVHAMPGRWLRHVVERYNRRIRTGRVLDTDAADTLAILGRLRSAAANGADSDGADTDRGDADRGDAVRGDAGLREAVFDLYRSHQLTRGHLERWDAGTMAHGLELRVPYLSRGLRRLALGLPPSLRLRLGDPLGTKHLVREAARRLLPLPSDLTRAVVERRKLAAPHAYRGPSSVLERWARRAVPSPAADDPFAPWLDRPLDRLLFDLFLLVFVGRRGQVDELPRLDDLYDRHRDELAAARDDASRS